MREAYIYGLYSTDNPNEIRYIGVSVEPEKRLQSHKLCVTNEREYLYNSYKGNWVRKIYSEGFDLQYRILAQFHSEHEAYAAEDAFICQYRETHRITNLAVGGRGGCITPPEKLEATRAKINATFATEEYREKHSKVTKEMYNKPGARDARSKLPKEMWQLPEYKEAHAEGLRKAREEKNYVQKSVDTKRTPEYREAARIRGEQQFSSQESREQASKQSKEHWAKLDDKMKEERTLKMRISLKHTNAKKKGLALELTPKPCTKCGEPK